MLQSNLLQRNINSILNIESNNINDFLNKKIKKNKNFHYILIGDTFSNKTQLCDEAFNQFKQEYNPIYLKTKFQNFNNNLSINYSNFFKLSTVIDTYKSLTIPINKKTLTFTYDSFEYNNENKTSYYTKPLEIQDKNFEKLSIIPNICEFNSYFTLNNKKDILIIDDIELLNLKTLYFLEFSFRKAYKIKYKKEYFFGNIKLLFFGNNNNSTNIINIFTSFLYNEEKNFLNKFNIIKIIYHIERPLCLFNSKQLNNIKNKKINNNLINILIERDINKNALLQSYFDDNTVYITETNNYAFQFNLEKLINYANKTNKQIYAIKTIKNFNDISNNETLEEVYKYFNKKLDTLFICKGAKVIIKTEILKHDIKNNQFGYIEDIVLSKQEVSETNHFDDLKYLFNKILLKPIIYITDPSHVNIFVSVNNKKIKLEHIKEDCYYFKYSNISIERYPIYLGWCFTESIFNIKNNIEKIVLVLSNNFSFYLFKKCLLLFDKNKIGIINSIFLYNKSLFQIDYLKQILYNL